MPDRAAHPKDISPTGWLALTRRVFREVGADHVGLVAAGCAFYGLLAIFPGLVALMAVGGLVIDPETVVAQFESVASLLPAEAASILLDQARSVAGAGSGGLGLAALIGIATAFYSASSGVAAMIEGLNLAYDVEEKRGFFALLGQKFLLTLGMIGGALLVVALLAIFPVALAFVPLGETLSGLLSLLRWPLLFLIVIGGLAILYRYGPSRPTARWRWITPGAVIATALWLVGSIGFAFYVRNFGSYNETFGALGGVIVLLMWLWLSSYIVLLGAEFDAEIEAQGKLDPAPATTDPDATGSDELARLRARDPIPGDERVAT